MGHTEDIVIKKKDIYRVTSQGFIRRCTVRKLSEGPRFEACCSGSLSSRAIIVH